jgi:hypothetical protein
MRFRGLLLLIPVLENGGSEEDSCDVEGLGVLGFTSLTVDGLIEV